MIPDSLRTHARAVVVASLAAVVAAAGLAWAAIPGSGGVIHGCYNSVRGDLRVIDAATSSCNNSETAISWNQTGPQGLQGEQGEQGPQGPQGDQGPSGPASSGGAGLVIGTLDSSGSVGFSSAITIGADGLGLISHVGGPQVDRDLKITHCEDVACTTATTDTLDSVGHVGFGSSVAIGTDGLGLISYLDSTADALKVAHCGDAACSTATIHTLDSVDDILFAETSIAIGTDGLGLISYSDGTTEDLKVAHCDDTACTTATTQTLNAAGDVRFGGSSIAIGSDGLGLISYQDDVVDDLEVAHCGDIACTTATFHTLDSAGSVGQDSTVAIGSDGLGLISYLDGTPLDGDLKVAHCDDIACSTATTHTLDSPDSVGSGTSVAIGSDGLGLISYSDVTNEDLKVAHCNDTVCTTATIHTLDSADRVGFGLTSIAIGTDGLGVISYSDATNQDLKIAHCGFVIC